MTEPADARLHDAAECREFFDTLGTFATVLAVKRYRIRFDALAVPQLPCLDHEAMLHEGIAPHASAYLQAPSGDLHEVACYPGEHRLVVDVVSTIGECSEEAHEQLMSVLRSRFPSHALRIVSPSWLRGERRVAKACRAQVTLRDVLTGDDLDQTKAAVDRLQTISSLMEKQSRVASWGARTIMTPFIALAGFLSYQILGTFAGRIGEASVELLRYGVVTVVGAVFVYYGLKAVQLTEMSNRVWKRSAEYNLILTERRGIKRS